MTDDRYHHAQVDDESARGSRTYVNDDCRAIIDYRYLCADDEVDGALLFETFLYDA